MLACVDVVACPGGCTLASIDSKDVRFGLEAHLEAHVAAQDDVCSHFYKPSGPTSTPGKKTRPWRCYYCEKSGAFESVANLVRHIYSKHVREPPPLIPSPRSPAKPPTKEERKARQETKRQAAKAVRPTVGLGSFFRALVSREERRRRREDRPAAAWAPPPSTSTSFVSARGMSNNFPPVARTSAGPNLNSRT